MVSHIPGVVSHIPASALSELPHAFPVPDQGCSNQSTNTQGGLLSPLMSATKGGGVG